LNNKMSENIRRRSFGEQNLMDILERWAKKAFYRQSYRIDSAFESLCPCVNRVVDNSKGVVCFIYAKFPHLES
jgi:hypothetical protein